MSNIIKSHYLAYSAVGSIAQTGQIIERLSDAIYLVEVQTQHGEDVNYRRIVSVNEIAGWRIYDMAYRRDNAVEEIMAAYEERIAKEKEAADKAAAEAENDASNEQKPEQN